jgi:uncharacterized protein
MQWLNEPVQWMQDALSGAVKVTAGGRTDFWRKTHDGGLRDSGHFYFESVAGDFTVQVKVEGRYADQYDQAGLMLRLDESIWMKCGIEYLNGVQQASVVLTHDWSDWSVLPLPNPSAIWLRVDRRGATVEVSFSLDGEQYTLIRQAHLSDSPILQAGIMLAAPTGPGFPVIFQGLSISQL